MDKIKINNKLILFSLLIIFIVVIVKFNCQDLFKNNFFNKKY